MRFLGFLTVLCSVSFPRFVQCQEIPRIPIPDNLNVLLQQNGIMVAQPRPTGLAKSADWTDPIKFVVRVASDAGSTTAEAVYDGGRFVGSTVVDGGQYVLDASNSLVQSVAGGVQWTASTLGNGVDYVVIKTADATTWTIKTGLDGVKLVVRQTASGVAWSVEKAVPDKVAIGGVTYVRLDPVKKVVKAGIMMPVKVASTTASAAQAATEMIIQTSAGVAVGTVDMVSGSINLSMDILTFAASNTAAIASAMVDLDANKVASRAWKALLSSVTNILNWGDLG